MKLFLTITASIVFAFCLIAGPLYYMKVRDDAIRLQMAGEAGIAEALRTEYYMSDRRDLYSNDADKSAAAEDRVKEKIEQLKKLKLSAKAKSVLKELQSELNPETEK